MQKQNLTKAAATTSRALSLLVVAAVAPKLGKTIDYLHIPGGLATAIYLPAGLIIGAEARRVLKCTSGQPYRIRVQ